MQDSMGCDDNSSVCVSVWGSLVQARWAQVCGQEDPATAGGQQQQLQPHPTRGCHTQQAAAPQRCEVLPGKFLRKARLSSCLPQHRCCMQACFFRCVVVGVLCSLPACLYVQV